MTCRRFPDKYQYPTKAIAKLAIRRWSIRQRSRFEAYRCQVCRYFHVGTKFSRLDINQPAYFETGSE